MTITLAAAQLVAGQASAPGVINYAISLDDVSTTDAFQLVQGTLTASAASLYAPASAHSAIVKGVQLKNTSASPVTVTWFMNGTATGNQAFQMLLPALGSATYDGRWTIYDSSGFAQTAGATGPTGARGATYRGIYSAAVNYVPDDIAADSGSSWICLVANGPGSAVHAPPTLPTTSNTWWSLVAAKGDQGIQGIQGNPGVVTTVVAGAGMTGGGSAASVTVDVIGNADGSIVVNADDIQVGNITEKVQDVVGALVVDSTLLDATYNDPSNTFTLDLLPQAQGILLGRAAAAGTGIPVPLSAAQVAVVLGLPVSPVRDYGAKFDHRVVFDGACSTGANTKITSATAAFVAADVGKRITLATAGASSAVYVGAITAIDSATQVTVSPAISTTASGKGLQIHTDDLAAWNALVADINTFTYSGARVIMERFGTNRSGVSADINTITEQITLEGIGGSYNHDTGDYARAEGTCIAYVGATQSTNGIFGAVLTFQPNTGATAQAQIGPFLRYFHIDCRNGDQNPALIGITINSCHGFIVDDVFVMDPGAIGIWTGVVQPGTSGALGEDKGCDRGSITNLRARCLENAIIGANTAAATLTPTTTTSAITLTTSGQNLVLAAANGLSPTGYVWVMTANGYPVLVNYTGGGGTTTLTGCTVSALDAVNAPTTVSGSNVVQAVPNNAAVVVLDGDLTANTNLSVFSMWQMSIGTNWGPAGVEFRNCDSLQLIQPVVNGGNATNDGAINRIRRPGFRFNGSNTNVGLPARNNVILSGDAGAGGCSSMGLLNTGAKLAFPTGPNYWELYQLGNGAAVPTEESFSSFSWTPNGGLPTGESGVALVASQAVTAATLTLINGTLLAIPPQGLQVGTVIRWTIQMTKTAVGTLGSLFQVRLGSTGTTADGIVAAHTSAAGTAAVGDWTVVIELTVRGPLGGTAAAIAQIKYFNTGTTGWSTLPFAYANMAMSTFNTVTSGLLYAHVAITSGATVVPTITQAFVEVVKSANP